MASLLEYENQIFLDAFQEDGLLIMARGLGIERIFTAFLKIYCDPGNLVLVLNTTDTEEEYFIDQLQTAGVKPLPKSIDSECSVDGRGAVYLEGGVLFITARILVIDMLIERIPLHLVTGILVYKAQRVIASCQEAFILRLYRQKNKTGFIKAFSDIPQAFTVGFCQVERIMKNLFVRKLYLWPRFQASVVALFERHKIDVVEIHVEMTEAMLSCQTALLNLIDACLKELKRCNRLLDTDDVKVEYAISKDFDKIIKAIVDPIWHQLSAKAKQLVADLRTLRAVLCNLTEYDCVNFYHVVHSIRSSEKIFGSNAGWLFTDAAESLFINAKKRLYKLSDDKTRRTSVGKESNSGNTNIELQFEECPKWQALKDILEEIEEDCGKVCAKDSSVCRVLVTAQDDGMCTQIKEYLCDGGTAMMLKQYKRLFAPKSSEGERSYEPAAVSDFAVAGQERTTWSRKTSPTKVTRVTRRNRNVPQAKLADNLTLTQMAGGSRAALHTDENSSAALKVDTDIKVEATSDYRLKISPMTVLYPLRGVYDPHRFIKTLDELKPTYVVLYDADIAVVRQLEVFKACHPDHPMRVYFLMFTKSVEEQRYLTILRKEKETFEYLIRQKSVMVVPEEREGKMENDPYLSRDATPASATLNTRKGGIEHQKSVQHRIIVDVREFRSELPSLIHQRGIDIDPVTIEVGDYILTPDICVERKSVSDLIGSLNNGRLYNQCISMCRSYSRPVLLIEFDASKPFTLQDRFPISGEISSNDVISRLTLLTMHFPRLRILWCSSPYVTAELFEELKIGRSQPVVKQAMAVASDTEAGHQFVGKYNSAAQDMLLKMPGITSKNVFSVMNRVKSVAQLVTLKESELSEILGSSANAKLLHEFIHADDQLQVAATGAVVETRPNKVKWKSEPSRKTAKKK